MAVLLLLLAVAAPAAPPPGPYTIHGLTCPSNVVEVSPGADLSTSASTPNTTYLLPAGTYNISASINVASGATEGLCYIGIAEDDDDVTVRLTTPSIAAFLLVTASTQLGLQGFVLDGSVGAGTTAIANVIAAGTRIAAQGVTFQRFTGGSVGVIQTSGSTSLRACSFVNNTVSNSGTLYCRATTVELDEVSGTLSDLWDQPHRMFTSP